MRKVVLSFAFVILVIEFAKTQMYIPIQHESILKVFPKSDFYTVNSGPEMYIYLEAANHFEIFVVNQSDDSVKQIGFTRNGELWDFYLNENNELDLNEIGITISETKPSNYRIVNLYDMDQDGLNDLIVLDEKYLSWMKNKGNGKYEVPVSLIKKVHPDVYASSYCPGWVMLESYNRNKIEIIALDFTKDFNPPEIRISHLFKSDMVQSYYEGDSLDYIIECDVDRNITFLPVKGRYKKMKGTGIESVFTVADMNNDKLPDIIGTQENEIRIHYGQSDGSFIESLDLLDEKNLFNQAVESAKATSRLEYSMDELKTYIPDWLSFGEVTALDFNHDGNMDLIYHGEYIVMYMNDGQQSFEVKFVDGPFDPNKIEIVDFQNDGFPDVLVDSFQGLKLINNDGEKFTELSLTKAMYMSVLSSIDMDRDNDLDIIYTDEFEILHWIENTDGVFQEGRKWMR